MPGEKLCPVADEGIGYGSNGREYSAQERLADGIVHAIGISSSLIAVPLLLVFALPRVSTGTGISLAIYGAAIITLFMVSAAYHMIPHLDWKPVLKRFDQAAIFIKIAGTYTPLAVILGSIFSMEFSPWSG
ncbi:MAG: hemolysin III family protein [Nitratireductor sp.]